MAAALVSGVIAPSPAQALDMQKQTKSNAGIRDFFILYSLSNVSFSIFWFKGFIAERHG
jgi:hypothetical protein